MRDTIANWKREWIETNGITHDLEVIIKDSSIEEDAPYAFEGSFIDIPNELLDRKVMDCGRILESSVPDRNGAYLLTV